MRILAIVAFCIALGGCYASTQEVRAKMGQDYIGKHVDTLVTRFGPPANSFRMQTGETSYVWQLASESSISVYRDGPRSASGSARTYDCKLNVIASPAGMITKLDTEDKNGGIAIVGMNDPFLVTGSICAERLGITRQG
jgi:hypothetical protein